MKRYVSVLLALVMLVLCVPFAVQGATADNAQQIEYAGGWSPSNYDPTDPETLYQGKIAVKKTVAPTELENYFDITLEAVARQQDLGQSVAVVVVMDISNTMNNKDGDTTSRLSEAKTAVNGFIDRYSQAAEISADREFALVTFNSYATLAIEPTVIGADNAEEIKTRVNDIVAPSDDRVRFTNIEGGLQLAYNIMKQSDAKYKYIIFATDGFPTTYIESGRESTTEIVGYDTFMYGNTYDESRLDEDGYFADSIQGKLCIYGTNYSDKAALRAAEVAKTIKDNGINIFTIGISVGAQSVQSNVDRSEDKTYAIVDRRSESYVIGDTADSYKTWLSTAIGGGDILETSQFEGHRYAAGNDQEALIAAFDNIMNDIKLAPLYTMREAYTLDPMSDHVEFLSFYGYDGALCDEIKNLNGDSVAVFDGSAKAITWYLIGSEFIKDETTGIFSFKISYKVRLKNESDGFTPDTALKTNKTTTFSFKTIDNDGNILYGDNKLEYTVPEVEGYLGTLEFAKLDADSKSPVADAEFTLCHNDDCTVCGGKVSINDTKAVSDEDGRVLFADIPSGHEYTLTETKAPDGYISDNTEYAVEIRYGKAYIDGSEANGDAVYNTKIAPVTIELAIEKRLTDDYGDRTLADGEFSFVLVADGYEGFGGEEIITNAEDGTGKFADAVLDKAGEYTFTVYEIKGDDENIEYDDTVYTLTVVVTQNGDSYGFETFVNDVSADNCSSFIFDFENKVLEPVIETPVVPGDSTNTLLYLLAALAGLGVALYAYRHARQKALNRF